MKWIVFLLLLGACVQEVPQQLPTGHERMNGFDECAGDVMGNSSSCPPPDSIILTGKPEDER